MLEDLGNDLKKVALAGVGAVTILAEKTTEVAKECVKRGGDTVEKGKIVTDDLINKAEQAAQERKERCTNENLARLTKEERETLRQKLDALDALDEEAARAAEEMDAAANEDEPKGDGE